MIRFDDQSPPVDGPTRGPRSSRSPRQTAPHTSTLARERDEEWDAEGEMERDMVDDVLTADMATSDEEQAEAPPDDRSTTRAAHEDAPGDAEDGRAALEAQVRRFVVERPLVAVGAALLAGFMVGRLLSK